MPNRDGTGPMGKGRLTGKGMGPCGGGFRRGMGRCGKGFFGGMGFRARELTKTEEKEILKEQSKILEEDLKELKKRLKELK